MFREMVICVSGLLFFCLVDPVRSPFRPGYFRDCDNWPRLHLADAWILLFFSLSWLFLYYSTHKDGGGGSQSPQPAKAVSPFFFCLSPHIIPACPLILSLNLFQEKGTHVLMVWGQPGKSYVLPRFPVLCLRSLSRSPEFNFGVKTSWTLPRRNF